MNARVPEPLYAYLAADRIRPVTERRLSHRRVVFLADLPPQFNSSLYWVFHLPVTDMVRLLPVIRCKSPSDNLHCFLSLFRYRAISPIAIGPFVAQYYRSPLRVVIFCLYTPGIRCAGMVWRTFALRQLFSALKRLISASPCLFMFSKSIRIIGTWDIYCVCAITAILIEGLRTTKVC